MTLRCGDEQREASVELEGRDTATVTFGQERIVLRVASDEGGHLRFECDGLLRTAVYAVDRTRAWVSLDGVSHAFVEPDLRAEAAESSDGTVRSPLSGTVMTVHVDEGESVTRSQLLVTVEAMKMEHRIEAPLDGVARDVTVRAGDQVAGEQTLLRIESEETEG